MMARAYTDDLRVRVLEAAGAGASARSAAARFGIGISTAIVWIRRARQDGERSARRQGKPRGSRLDAHEAFIVEMIETDKDITLNEMVARLKAERALEIGRSALSAWLRGRGWTFKKSQRMHWSRSARTS
jgi:transposase